MKTKIFTIFVLTLTLFTYPQTTLAKVVYSSIQAAYADTTGIGFGLKKTVTCYTTGNFTLSRKQIPSSLNIMQLFMSFEKDYEVQSYKYLVDDNGSVADFSSIQDAIDAASDGDRIYVCPGTYAERITIDKDIELIGVDGADSTSIDASTLGDGSVVFLAASSLVQGFTITGAKSDYYCFYGGGIKIAGILGQTTNYPIIQNNKIINNTGCKAGAIHLAGLGTANGDHVDNSAIIRNNIIAGNYSNTSNSPVMVNCDYTVDSVIENNVFADNSTASGPGAIQVVGSGCSTNIRNNIFYSNASSSSTMGIINDYSGGAELEYNCFHANSGDALTGTGNLNSNPDFINERDYRLDTSSPCINTGDPDSSYNDLDGSRNDMGAYGGPYGDW